MKKAWIVVDLGYGDAGKGMLTDALVRRTGARVVVRYNGGAQAGHNVVTADGLHHTFAQLGAGSFVPGTVTWLGPEVIVHPTALLAELRIFTDKAPLPEVWLSPACRVVTPWHQALNRLRELARGPARHGSCGVGIGEVVRDALANVPIRAGDLGDHLIERAEAVRRRLWPEAETLATDDRELRAFRDPDVVERWARAAVPVVSRVHDGLAETLERAEHVVFEGAQGVLLDETFGFAPHTTWSTTTDRHALTLVGDRDRCVLGVIRAWMVRHGAGPLASEDPAVTMEDHNAANAWQGAVRYGHFDAELLRYSLGVQPVDRLVVTHMDALARQPWRPVERWDNGPVFGAERRDEGEVRAAIAALLGRPVDGAARGPTEETLDLPLRPGS